MGAEITILDHADRHGSLVDMLKDARELNSHCADRTHLAAADQARSPLRSP